MSRTVHLHIGVAKSGTTYLQNVLFANKAELVRRGVLFPGTGPGAHFMASMDLRGTGFQGHRYAAAEGSWDRLVAETNAFGGAAVISHETFARASTSSIPKAVESFGTDDVRIVVTARDLGRQVPAVWQETVKNRGQQPFGEFLERVFRSEQGARRAGTFWKPQHLTALTARWADVVGLERLTVVTVPPAGADRSELWHRFAAALDLPDMEYVVPENGGNPSLGVVESEFLRRLNGMVADVDWPTYESQVKKWFAERVLAGRPQSAPLQVPAAYRDDVRAAGEEMLEELRRSPYRIIGDVEDLRPRLPETSGPWPDDIGEAQLLELSLGLVGEYATKPEAPNRPQSTLVHRIAGRMPPSVKRSVRRLQSRL